MEIDTINNEIIIQPCSPKKLAAVYGVSTKVLRTRLCPRQQVNVSPFQKLYDPVFPGSHILLSLKYNI